MVDQSLFCYRTNSSVCAPRNASDCHRRRRFGSICDRYRFRDEPAHFRGATSGRRATSNGPGAGPAPRCQSEHRQRSLAGARRRGEHRRPWTPGHGRTRSHGYRRTEPLPKRHRRSVRARSFDRHTRPRTTSRPQSGLGLSGPKFTHDELPGRSGVSAARRTASRYLAVRA